MAVVTLISTSILCVFGYFAVSGRNPLEKLDEAAAKRRAIFAKPQPRGFEAELEALGETIGARQSGHGRCARRHRR